MTLLKMTATRTRLWVAPLLLVLAGCANNGLGDETAYDEPRDMFLTGYRQIDSIYIKKVDFEDLSVAGLTQVASLDPTVSITREGDKVDLKVGGRDHGVFAPGEGTAATAWANLSADVLAAARAASPDLKAKPNEEVYDAFYSGALSKLDPFSRYSTAEEAAENRASREGFGGIGIRVEVEGKAVRVLSVMHYTPGEHSGLHADDIITHVDGKSVAGLQQNEVIDLLRGPIDSHVTLTVVRGKSTPFTVDVKRALIVPETVVYERKGSTAYLHVYGFNADTADSLRKEMQHARQDIGAALKGYVLDLRGNPGGLLDQSVAVSDLFIDDGRIVSTHGRHPDSHQYFEATAGDVAKGLPLVVLVNGDSASAAEIVAAALQDSGRAVVVGSTSYGKGTVQQVIRMPNDGELTLTWARFHAPSGYTLNHLGVIPSVCTTLGNKREKQLIEDLRQGRVQPVPTARRNATDPEDTDGLKALRATCPERHGQDAIDEQVAIDLVTHPSLYRRAVHLADLPGSSKGTVSAAAESDP